MPTDKEIDEVLNRAADAEEAGQTNWPGMTYEQGVRAAVLWMRGESNDNPMAE